MQIFKYLSCSDCKKRKEVETESRKPTCSKCGSSNVRYGDKWYINIQVNGEPIKRPVSPVKRDAEKAIEEAKNGKEYIRLTNKKAITFSELATQYLTHCTRQASYQAKKHHLDHFIEIFGAKPVYEVSPASVRDEHNALAKGKTESTADRYLATLKTCFQFAEDQGHIDYSVLHAIQKVKLYKPNNKRKRYLTVKEYHQLIEAAKTVPCQDLADIIIFATYTGLRQANVLGCRHDKHIDLDNGLVIFPAEEMKGGEEQVMPMVPTIKDLVTRRPRHFTSPYLFFNKKGGPYSRHTIRDNFDLACERARLENFTFHDLRHTLASWMGMSGSNAKHIQGALGHSSMSMTDRYTHMDIEHLRQALIAVEQNVIAGGE